jgi:hypothetical protein
MTSPPLRSDRIVVPCHTVCSEANVMRRESGSGENQM